MPGGDDILRSGIGGHDHDGILKIDLMSLGVGDMAVVQHLEKDIEHVGMGFSTSSKRITE